MQTSTIVPSVIDPESGRPHRGLVGTPSPSGSEGHRADGNRNEYRHHQVGPDPRPQQRGQDLAEGGVTRGQQRGHRDGDGHRQQQAPQYRRLPASPARQRAQHPGEPAWGVSEVDEMEPGGRPPARSGQEAVGGPHDQPGCDHQQRRPDHPVRGSNGDDRGCREGQPERDHHRQAAAAGLNDDGGRQRCGADQRWPARRPGSATPSRSHRPRPR